MGNTKFDLYESILLLTIYLSAKNKGVKIGTAAIAASSILRKYAMCRGITIDENFRSIAGIQGRLRIMQMMFENTTTKKTETVKIYSDVIELYNHNRNEFNQILETLLKQLPELNDWLIEEKNMNSKSENEGDIKMTDKNGIPESIIATINELYDSGLRFDDTVIHLIEQKSSTDINDDIVAKLQTIMFQRNDGLYFFVDSILSEDTSSLFDKKSLINKIDCYGCIDINALYKKYCEYSAGSFIRDVKDFADYLLFLHKDSIRIKGALKTQIIKKIGVSVKDALKITVDKVVKTIESNNCITIEELVDTYPVFTEEFLNELLEKYTDEIVPIIINDYLCYQTINSIGLDEAFSEKLNAILEELDNLAIVASQDIIHALLSTSFGYNFRNEYSIPDDKTFRRIISMYYNGSKKRIWKAGSFTEANNNNV